jgi:hypothetical protein
MTVDSCLVAGDVRRRMCGQASFAINPLLLLDSIFVNRLRRSLARSDSAHHARLIARVGRLRVDVLDRIRERHMILV